MLLFLELEAQLQLRYNSFSFPNLLFFFIWRILQKGERRSFFVHVHKRAYIKTGFLNDNDAD